MMENFSVPFDISLPEAPRDCCTVTCDSVIRHLPGKRIVCQGSWEGRAVIVKLLFQRRHCRRHWLRQERGIAALMERGLSVPLPLYSGRYVGNDAVGYCIVSLFIEDGKTLDVAWEEAKTTEERQALLRSALGCLATVHEKGIVQQDLHFQNFLLDGPTFYLLDPDGMAITQGPLAKKYSLADVALFFAQLPPRYDAWAPSLVEEYTEKRGWRPIESASDFLFPAIRKRRSVRVKKLLQKIFRQSTHYASVKGWGVFSVFRRAMSGPGAQGFIRDPEGAIPADNRGNLKRGNTSTVSKTALDGRTVVIKRYNIKNALHGVSRAFRKTRAAISWANAHRLSMLGINTAAPLALVERRFGPVRRESYYVSAYVEGKGSKEFFADSETSSAEKSRIADSIAELFAALSRHRISHGDMKATNILIAGNDVVLVDLDALRQHRYRWTFRRAFKKDIARLLRNWDDEPETKKLFAEKLTAMSF